MQDTPIHASFLRRCIASLFDALLMTLLALTLTFSFLPVQSRFDDYRANPTVETRKEFLLARNIARNIALLLWLIYSTVAEASRLNGTLGKYILGLRVTDFSGKRISLQQSVKRSTVKLLSLLPFGIGFIWALLNRRHITWHDKAAHTVVIRWTS